MQVISRMLKIILLLIMGFTTHSILVEETETEILSTDSAVLSGASHSSSVAIDEVLDEVVNNEKIHNSTDLMPLDGVARATNGTNGDLLETGQKHSVDATSGAVRDNYSNQDREISVVYSKNHSSGPRHYSGCFKWNLFSLYVGNGGGALFEFCSWISRMLFVISTEDELAEKVPNCKPLDGPFEPSIEPAIFLDCASSNFLGFLTGALLTFVFPPAGYGFWLTAAGVPAEVMLARSFYNGVKAVQNDQDERNTVEEFAAQESKQKPSDRAMADWNLEQVGIVDPRERSILLGKIDYGDVIYGKADEVPDGKIAYETLFALLENLFELVRQKATELEESNPEYKLFILSRVLPAPAHT